jgi:hypothetical protein
MRDIKEEINVSKRLFISLLITLVLSISIVLPVSAGSDGHNVVDIERFKENFNEPVLIDDGINYYEGIVVYLHQWTVVYYADGTAKTTMNWSMIENVTGYGIYGTHVGERITYNETWTDNVINGPVVHIVSTERLFANISDYSYGYRIVYSYANGNVRADVHKEWKK